MYVSFCTCVAGLCGCAYAHVSNVEKMKLTRPSNTIGASLNVCGTYDCFSQHNRTPCKRRFRGT